MTLKPSVLCVQSPGVGHFCGEVFWVSLGFQAFLYVNLMYLSTAPPLTGLALLDSPLVSPHHSKASAHAHPVLSIFSDLILLCGLTT